MPGSARCPRAGWAAGQDRDRTGQSLAGGEQRFGLGAHPGVTRWTLGREGVQVPGSFREYSRKEQEKLLRDLSAVSREMLGGCSGCGAPAFPPSPPSTMGVLVALSGRAVVTLGVWGSLGWVASDQPRAEPRCRRRQRGFGAAPCPVPQEPGLGWGVQTGLGWGCSGVFGYRQPLAAPGWPWLLSGLAPGAGAARGGGNPLGWAGARRVSLLLRGLGTNCLSSRTPQGKTRGSGNPGLRNSCCSVFFPKKDPDPA